MIGATGINHAGLTGPKTAERPSSAPIPATAAPQHEQMLTVVLCSKSKWPDTGVLNFELT